MDFSEIMRRRYGLAGHNQVNIKPMVDSCIEVFEKGDIASLQNELFQLVSNFNKPGSGRLITGFAEKDRLAECFTLCLQYDWMNDSNIREVWEENGFYCIVDYLLTHWSNKQDLVAASLDLFCFYTTGRIAWKQNSMTFCTKRAYWEIPFSVMRITGTMPNTSFASFNFLPLQFCHQLKKFITYFRPA